MAISLGNSEAITNSQIASTLQHARSILTNAITNATPLLSFLMGEMGGRMRSARGMEGDTLPGTIVGGRDIDVPVRVKQSTAVGSYKGSDTLDISDQDTDRTARYPIAQNYGSVRISGRERRGNKGEAAIYNLLQGKTTAMQEDLRVDLDRQAVADGTGNSGKDLLGLAALVSTSTYAGLNPATYSSWQPGHDSAGNGINDSVGAFGANLQGEMITRYNTVSNGTDSPDASFSAENVFGWYETNLTATANGAIQYTTFEFGEFGFEGLRFKGGPFFFDREINDGDLYYLNSAHIMFTRDSEGDFAWLDGEQMQRPVDQDAFVRIMIVEGNIITNDRRKIGRSGGVSAT